MQYIFPVCIENLYFETILNIWKCHYNILKKKISFYQNVFLSFYLNVVCKNIVCDVGLNGFIYIISNLPKV
jgi:hypothetical protein